MISNTDLFFAKAKAFQDKRADFVTVYEKKKQVLERFKGSKGYDEELKSLNEKLEKDLQNLREEYEPIFQTIFSGMLNAIGRRSISAPTTDQVNLLNMLKMKKNITAEEVYRTAEAVRDNPIAVSIVSEIARDHGIFGSFQNYYSEMSSQTASETVQDMKEIVKDFMLYDTTRASRRAKSFYEDRYGTTEGYLRKRDLFTDKEGCFRELSGMDPESLKMFSEIVDA